MQIKKSKGWKEDFIHQTVAEKLVLPLMARLVVGHKWW